MTRNVTTALQDNDHSILADQAEDRITAPAVLDEKEHAHHHAFDHKFKHAHDHGHGHEHEHPFEWPEAVRIGIVAISAAAVWFGVWEPYPAFSVIGVLGLAIGGWPIFKEAFENIVERRMTMELSMTIAIVAAAAIGEFFTALVITLFDSRSSGIPAARGVGAARWVDQFRLGRGADGGRRGPGRARWAHPGRRDRALRPFVRRRIPHHR